MRLDHVGLAVVDLEAAARWWAAAFAMQVELELRVEPIDLDIVMLVSPEHGHRIELLHRPGTAGDHPQDPAAAASRAGYGHVAFDVRDLDGRHAALLAQGAREVMSPRPSPEPGVRMSFLADPDGNLIELVSRPVRPAPPEE